MLEKLRDKIKEILLTEVKDIIMSARKDNMIVIEEKGNGDSATIADVKIGESITLNFVEMHFRCILLNSSL